MKKITTSFLILAIVVNVIILGGCTQSKNIGRQMVIEPDPVALKLSSAVDRASAALQTLAAVEQHKTPLATVSSVSNVPKELLRTISVEWTGPLEPIVKTVANRAGYRFSILGAKPPVPIVVQVRSVEKTVIDVLRDIGLQSGTRADVVVDADRKIVEINYDTIHDIVGGIEVFGNEN